MSLRAFLFLLAAAPSLVAQQPVTRAQAVAAALARGTRAAFGRADSGAAAGARHGARLYPNPLLSATYTKDVPHYHVIADLPLDLPWIRAARIGTAAAARDAVHYGVAFERAAIRFDVDTAYTRALAAAARARLSRRRALALAHRSVLAAPSLQVGVERGDPTGPGGDLPTVGLSLPLPLFNWNGGEVAQAAAARDRAQANLDLVRRETEAELTRARRALTLALARLERDRLLLFSADRVAAMSLQAYAEGAIALAHVLAAQRNAR